MRKLKAIILRIGPISLVYRLRLAVKRPIQQSEKDVMNRINIKEKRFTLDKSTPKKATP